MATTCASSPYVALLVTNGTAVALAPQGVVSPERQQYYTVLVVLQAILTLVGIVYFRLNKRRFERTRVRRTSVLMLYVMGSAVMFNGGILLPYAVGLEHFPCWLTRILTLSLMPFINSGNIIRNSVFAVRTRWSHLAPLFGHVQTGASPIPNKATSGTTTIKENDAAADATTAGNANASDETSSDDDAWTNAPPPIFRSIAYCVSSFLHTTYPRTPAEARRAFDAMRFLYSRRGLGAYITLTMAPFVVFHVAYVFSDPAFNCTGCPPLYQSSIPIIMACEVVPFLLIAMVVASRLGRQPDPWAFFSIEARLTAPLVAIAFIVQQIIAFTPWDASAVVDVQIIATVTGTATIYVMTLLPFWIAKRRGEPDLVAARRKRRQEGSKATTAMGGGSTHLDDTAPSSPTGSSAAPTVGMGGAATASAKASTTASSPASTPSSSAVNKKRPTVILGNSNNNANNANASILINVRRVRALTTILTSSDATMLDAFRAHLADEWSSELLTFLEDTARWIATFTDVAPNARAARAKKVVRMYVQPGSVNEINIDGRMRQELLSKVSKAETSPGELLVSVFNDARQEVAKMLSDGAATRFLAKWAAAHGATTTTAGTLATVADAGDHDEEDQPGSRRGSR